MVSLTWQKIARPSLLLCELAGREERELVPFRNIARCRRGFVVKVSEGGHETC